MVQTESAGNFLERGFVAQSGPRFRPARSHGANTHFEPDFVKKKQTNWCKGVEPRGFLMGEAIKGPEGKLFGFFVTIHETLVIQCSHSPAASGWEPFVEFRYDFQKTPMSKHDFFAADVPSVC